MSDPAPAAWPPVVRPFGDSGVLIDVEADGAFQRAALVHGIADWIEDVLPEGPGWGRPIPGAATVLVTFDPVEPGLERALAKIEDILAAMSRADAEGAWPDHPRIVEIPVRYGGPDGPDLDAVAKTLGHDPDDVILLHASRIYRVLFVGFVAGFAYCGTLPAELALPRRSTPRTRVEPGSVVITGRMTGVLPVVTPSGWHVIGRTSEGIWNPARRPPGLLEPGDGVRFVPWSGT